MGHFYDKEGKPVFEVPMTSKKGTRPTDVRDARKLGLNKSVTTVLKIPTNYNLDVWKQNELLEAVLLDLRQSGGTIDLFKHAAASPEDAIKKWKRSVIDQSNNISKSTAEFGNKLHEELEKFCSGIKIESDNELHGFLVRPSEVIKNLCRELVTCRQEAEDVTKYLVTEESFSCNEYRYGGTIDLYSKQGNFLMDFKSKNKDVVDKKTPYFSHCIQLAAYRYAKNMSSARCFNLYVSSTVKGMVYLHEWTQQELDKGLEMFLLLNKYYDLENNML